MKQPIFNNINLNVVAFIALLWGIYIYDFYLDGALTLYGGISSDHSDTYRFLTYGFLHADEGHLFFNSIWLLIFGSVITRYFSVRSFLIIFITGIIIGGISYLFIEQEGSKSIMIGASAGVSALLGSALRFIFKIQFDFNQRPLLLKIFDTRYLVILALFIFLDIANAFIQYKFYGYNIAWHAHIAGLITGAVLMSFPFINHKSFYRETK